MHVRSPGRTTPRGEPLRSVVRGLSVTSVGQPPARAGPDSRFSGVLPETVFCNPHPAVIHPSQPYISYPGTYQQTGNRPKTVLRHGIPTSDRGLCEGVRTADEGCDARPAPSRSASVVAPTPYPARPALVRRPRIVADRQHTQQETGNGDSQGLLDRRRGQAAQDLGL